MNDQHFEVFDSIQGLFVGEPNKIHINVVLEKVVGEDGEDTQKQAEVPKEKDPLASTEEEDLNAGFLPRNFTELDCL